MAGFGGSSSMALLTGLVQGFNKNKENERLQERTAILNRQAEQQVTESQDRIRRAGESAERVAAKDQLATETAAREQEELAARQGQIAELILRDNPDITPEQAAAVAGSLPPTALANLVAGDSGKDDLDPLEQARAREVSAKAEEQEAENLLAAETRELRNSQLGLRIRRSFLGGDEKGLELAVMAAVGGGSHSMEAVEAYLADIAPKDRKGEVKLNAPQKQTAKIQGVETARLAVTQFGSAAAALKALTDAVLAAPADDPFTQAQQESVLKELQRIVKEEGDFDSTSPSSGSGLDSALKNRR